MLELLEREISLNFEKSSLPRDSRRLFHGRGKIFPGHENLVVDYFDPVVQIILYRAYDQNTIDELRELLLELISPGSIILQKRYLDKSPSEVIYGVLPENIEALESNFRFKLSFGHNQNNGFFLDMKDGRELIKKYSKGAKVLNLFSYTCALSVVAIAGGAKEVLNVDMNKKSLSTGRDNHRLNGQDLTLVKYLSHNVMKSFSKFKRRGPFDLIIIDPPSFQSKSFNYKVDYPKIIKKLPRLIDKSAYIMACLNEPFESFDFIYSMFEGIFKEVEVIEQETSPAEFKEADKARGVKIVLFQVTA